MSQKILLVCARRQKNLRALTYNKDDKACNWVLVGLTKAELSTPYTALPKLWAE